MFFRQLVDVDVPAHREVDECRGDVPDVGGVVNQRAELRRRCARYRFVPNDVRAFDGISAVFVPATIREPEDEERNQQRNPTEDLHQLFVRLARSTGDVSRRPADAEGQSVVWIKRMTRVELDFIAVTDDV